MDFDCHNQMRLFRKTDPETSAEAAERIVTSGAADAQRQKVLEALRQMDGLTSAELAHVMRADRHMVGRRLPDLRRIGAVKQGAKRICRVNGTNAMTWWIVDKGEVQQ